MTIFRNKDNGKLYVISKNALGYGDKDSEYYAVPYNHGGERISGKKFKMKNFEQVSIR